MYVYFIVVGDIKNNNDEDDIAVIWSSENGKNTPVDKRNEETISIDNTEKKTEVLFFVDTIGDDSNLKKISLLPPSQALYTTNSFPKVQTVPTTATTTITSEKVINNNNNDHNKVTDDTCNKTCRKLREIIVDGLNVAFGYVRFILNSLFKSFLRHSSSARLFDIYKM